MSPDAVGPFTRPNMPPRIVSDAAAACDAFSLALAHTNT
eukprot:CAMPEP_0183365854 /NCGR_PEP_ID=MMETSP0164_2-20130417/86337_1 /TAXON_ID=221442 /ORGANISM="Coccolithus pelagicus ssp braarudi, Strain PLY182g" /LENGTH=38 /DNA_ID= /DNA_START= /DNA_END= /DNA_ORIENTATION=